MLSMIAIQLPLIVLSGVSSMLATRFVRRHEVPRLTLWLGWLVPGAGMLTAGLFLDGQLDVLLVMFLQSAGAIGTVMGFIGLATLLWSTRLTGLQPRVTPIDLSSDSSHFD